jgi:hypothetical protein
MLTWRLRTVHGYTAATHHRLGHRSPLLTYRIAPLSHRMGYKWSVCCWACRYAMERSRCVIRPPKDIRVGLGTLITLPGNKITREQHDQEALRS